MNNKKDKQIKLMQTAFLLLACVQLMLFFMFTYVIFIHMPNIWTGLFELILIASTMLCLFASGILPTKEEEEK